MPNESNPLIELEASIVVGPKLSDIDDPAELVDVFEVELVTLDVADVVEVFELATLDVADVVEVFELVTLDVVDVDLEVEVTFGAGKESLR